MRNLRIAIESTLFILGLLVSSQASATVFAGSKIAKLSPSKTDVYYVYFTGGTVTGAAPACGTSTPLTKRLAIKPSTETGKVLIATLMVALAEGKKVNAWGENQFPALPQCAIAADAESLYNLSME